MGEDRDFALQNEELRRRRAEDAQHRQLIRMAEGGKCGGLNDRQDPADRREFEDTSGYDDFGRRKKAKVPGGLPPHCQDKRDRMQAALERLHKRAGSSASSRLDRSRSPS